MKLPDDQTYWRVILCILQETLQDIDGIKEDIARVRERGRQVVESSDPEGYRAMQATLAMLSDRVENLQAMADDKGRQLQVSDVIRSRGLPRNADYTRHVVRQKTYRPWQTTRADNSR